MGRPRTPPHRVEPTASPGSSIELKRLRDKVLEEYPYEAFRLLGELRCSFIAPVPNRLDERVERR